MLWGCLLLDGALAHLSRVIQQYARKLYGFVLNWGPVGHFERRPNIERFFGNISQDLFLRLPSSTGNGAGKGRPDNAEKNAIHYEIMASDIEQLIDVSIRNYNGIPSLRISGLSPLEFIRYYLDKGDSEFIGRKSIERNKGAKVIMILPRFCGHICIIHSLPRTLTD